MSGEQPEYIPLKLVVNTKNEASIGLIYLEQKSGQKAQNNKMIYKIYLDNVYSLEKTTRDAIKEKIFFDHSSFLQRDQEMEDNIDKAVQLIIDERQQRIDNSKSTNESDSHASKEGCAAKMPTTKSK